MINEFERIIKSNTCMPILKSASIMITGATGTIGYYLVSLLMYYNDAYNANIKLYCPVRNIQKAKKMYGNAKNLFFVEYELNQACTFDFEVDYVIHCAGPTRSSYMVQYPVDTINAVYGGTEKLLHFFKNNGRKGFLYVSSVEIYGENYDADKILTEETVGAVDTLKVRSSYPEAKRLAENLCVAYANQYGLPIKIVRLTQILGKSDGDNRLIAYLCDCAKNKQNIVLKSDGKAIKAYCYIADCVSAMLYALVKGENIAYNVANEEMALSVYQLAKYVSQKYLDGSVTIENSDSKIYPKSSVLVMDSKKLRDLGWRPEFGLEESLELLIK